MFLQKKINKSILIKYWMVISNVECSLFKLNYTSLSFFCGNFVFLNVLKIWYNISYVIPFIFSLINTRRKITFVGTKYLFNKTISNSFSYLPTISFRKPSLFKYKDLLKLCGISELPTLIFFFNLKYQGSLLIDLKRSYIPSLGIFSVNENVSLIDFPIYVNKNFFYTTYLINLIFFKLIILKNSNDF